MIVECKKRRSMNVHAFFAEATCKYGGEGKNLVILASKVPLKGSLKKSIKAMQKKREKLLQAKLAKDGKHLSSRKLTKLEKRLRKKQAKRVIEAEKKLRARHDITALVTVELDFFAQLFKLWLREGNHDKAFGSSKTTTRNDRNSR